MPTPRRCPSLQGSLTVVDPDHGATLRSNWSIDDSEELGKLAFGDSLDYDAVSRKISSHEVQVRLLCCCEAACLAKVRRETAIIVEHKHPCEGRCAPIDVHIDTLVSSATIHVTSHADSLAIPWGRAPFVATTLHRCYCLPRWRLRRNARVQRLVRGLVVCACIALVLT